MIHYFILIFGLILSDSGKSESITLTLFDKVQVHSERFILAQVATCAGSEIRCRLLRSIDLGKSPRPSEKKFLTGSEISQILKEEGFNLEPNDKEIAISGHSVTLESLSYPIESELIRQKVEEQLDPFMNTGTSKRWSVSLTLNSRLVNLPSPEWGAKLIGFEKHINEMLMSRSPIVRRVQIRVFNLNGRDYHEDIWGTIRFTPTFKALTILTAVEKGAVLSEGDVTESWVGFAQFMEGVPSEKSSVVGKRARISLRPGSLLRWGVIENIPLVGRGDEVEIKLISGALEMDTKGKAMASGSLGDTIEVEMLGSKKRIKSLVLSNGKVEVKL